MTSANVLSAIALFVALGGTSYAAVSSTGDEATTRSPDQTAQPGQVVATPEPAGQRAPDQPQAGQSSPGQPQVEQQASPAGDDARQPQAGGEAHGPAIAMEPPVTAGGGDAADSRDDPVDPSMGDRGDPPGSEHEQETGGGPPPWAPAHGWRCQQAGNAPGSPAFQDCVKSATP